MARGLVVAVAAMGLAALLAHAERDGGQFESSEGGVRLSAPRGWHVSVRTAYPNVLRSVIQRSPRGRILVTAEQLEQPAETAQSYARRTSTKLSALGFRVRAPQVHGATGAYWIDLEDERSALRQAFLVNQGIGYTLTLAADDARSRGQHL